MRTTEEIFFDLIDLIVAELRRTTANVSDTSEFQTQVDTLKAELIARGGKKIED